MRRSVFIFLAILLSFAARPQVVFKTVLKKGPVVAGESFQVQYVLEDIDKNAEFYAPDFKDFRFVSGPYTYEGSAYGTDGPKKLRNIVYTLEAREPGHYRINGAAARVEDHFIKSDDVWLEVISASEAIARGLKPGSAESNSPSYLLPGEDAYKKIRNNLFMKVLVDKTACYVGEPITATFKLYSRLMSRSDIVKNPGFYGFTVQDMVGLNDKQSTSETVNGKRFDVHTIRKVQLYPLQAGRFIIDPMEVKNEVSFSKSRVNKKTEQEIVEGIFADVDADPLPDSEVFKTSMSTKEIVVDVKPTPQKNRPVDFTGATGRFLISAVVNKNDLSKNEEGELLITVSGKGNFTQLAAPVVAWPAGIEGFEPQVKDALDHNESPMKGERTFRYSFVSAKPGQYTIPALKFSFFDPDSNNYKTVSTQGLSVTIDNTEKKETGPASTDDVDVDRRGYTGILWQAGLAALLAVVVAGFIWLKRREKSVVPESQPANTRPSLATILHPAFIMIGGDDRSFYSTLRQCIWQFFEIHFNLTGSKMSRQELQTILRNEKIDETTRETIMEILQQCEAGIFTTAELNIDKKELFETTKTALERVYSL